MIFRVQVKKGAFCETIGGIDGEGFSKHITGTFAVAGKHQTVTNGLLKIAGIGEFFFETGEEGNRRLGPRGEVGKEFETQSNSAFGTIQLAGFFKLFVRIQPFPGQ